MATLLQRLQGTQGTGVRGDAGTRGALEAPLCSLPHYPPVHVVPFLRGRQPMRLQQNKRFWGWQGGGQGGGISPGVLGRSEPEMGHSQERGVVLELHEILEGSLRPHGY